LAHELAHWVTDRFAHPLSPPNPAALQSYGIGQPQGDGRAVTEVVEGIAELATFAAINRLPGKDLRDSLLNCFQEGHRHLRDDYRAFDLCFEFWPLDQVVGHLIRLARRNDSAAKQLKGTKGGREFEYHWLGLEAAGIATYPWMLHREDGPAVVISSNPPDQIPHDPSGWYWWPSKMALPIQAQLRNLAGTPDQRPAGYLASVRSIAGCLLSKPVEALSYRDTDSKWGVENGTLSKAGGGLNATTREALISRYMKSL
jgi:hypothetical protein